MNTCCLNARVSWAQEARWRLSFSGITSLGRSGSDHASAVLLETFPSDHVPVVAATVCLVPFLLDPAAALGRPPPWRIKLQCLALVAAFLLGVSSAACTQLPQSESVLASLHLPAWSSVHSWLLCLRFGSLSARALLPAPTPVWHMSAPVRRGAAADARLDLASSPNFLKKICISAPIVTINSIATGAHGSPLCMHAFTRRPSATLLDRLERATPTSGLLAGSVSSRTESAGESRRP